MDSPNHDTADTLERHLATLNATQALTKVGGWQWDIDANEMYWTDEVYRIHGMDPGDIPAGSETHIGRSLACYAPEDRPKIRSAFERCIRDGQPYDLEFQFTKVSGERIWIRTIGQPVFEAGQVVRVLGTLIDLTSQKEAEAALRTSEERLQAILEASPDPIVVYDNQGHPQFLNPAFSDLFGWTLEELKGHKIPFIPEDQQALTTAKIKEIFTNGKPVQFLSRRLTKGGDTVDIVVSAAIIRGSAGKAEGMVVNLTNVSEQMRLEAQLQQNQRMEAIGRLAGGVAHDFNNKLGVIIGHTELAIDRIEASHPVQDDLKAIFNAAQRSAELTKQLLAFARRQTAAPKILDLNATISGMLKMLRRLIGEEIDLVWKPGSPLWPVKIDPVQLDQILANLCANAKDAIDGVGQLTIATRNVRLGETLCAQHPDLIAGDYVCLTIGDTGSGMDAGTREKLFEPFYTTKTVDKGVGLGLAMVYGIIRQNQGCIRVESTPGHGTTFEIYLPRTPAEAEPDSCSATAKSARGSDTILVVEDETAILRLIKTILNRLGYTILTARRPSEALHLVSHHPDPIHLLITDVVMPEMNGKALREKIEEHLPKIRTLFMSGYTTDAIVHRGILEADVHFLQKPFTMDSLAGKVREILDGVG
jgi:two-component system, cell cycle sensor histidine kinase and response regulator CckA